MITIKICFIPQIKKNALLYIYIYMIYYRTNKFISINCQNKKNNIKCSKKKKKSTYSSRSFQTFIYILILLAFLNLYNELLQDSASLHLTNDTGFQPLLHSLKTHTQIHVQATAAGYSISHVSHDLRDFFLDFILS